MEEQKQIDVKMYKVDEDVLPFVEIKFKGMDSNIYSALMLMDSGSSVNTLMTEMRVHIGKDDWLPNESDKVVTIANEATIVPCGQFQFEMDGTSFQEKFFVFDNQHLMQLDGMLFVGVLGNRFMQKYHLAIDYSSMTVHTSDMTLEKLKKRKCDFFAPMDYGLKFYNTPILTIRGKKRNAIIIADTGCDDFSISQNAIEECDLTYKLTGRIQTLDGPDGSVEAKECILNFELAEYRNDIINSHFYQETAEILPHSFNVTDEGGKLLSPIEGMIGFPFMARNEWILDFGAKAIYKHPSNYKSNEINNQQNYERFTT